MSDIGDDIRILVADDHALFREGLRYILQDLAGQVELLEAETFPEVESALASNPDIDIILLDLQMPGMSGMQSLKSLNETYPDKRVVVLSASEERNDVRQALRFGAKGYIPKSSSRDVMVSALRLVLSGGSYLPPFLLETDSGDRGDRVDAADNENGRAGSTGLTPRQSQVLEYLGQGKSNKEIARALGLAEGTVKIHIAGILKALNVSNRTQAVIAASRMREAGGSL